MEDKLENRVEDMPEDRMEDRSEEESKDKLESQMEIPLEIIAKEISKNRMGDPSDDRIKDMPKDRVQDKSEDRNKSKLEGRIENPLEIIVKDIYKDRIKDPREDKIQDLSEDRIQDQSEEKNKSKFDDQIEDPLEISIKDISKERIEDPHEDKFQDMFEDTAKKQIKDRIKVSLKNKAKNPLKKMIKAIENSESIYEITPPESSDIHSKIKFGISNEELYSKLTEKYGVFLSVKLIVKKKKEKFSYENLRIYIKFLENLIMFKFMKKKLAVSEIENLIRKINLFNFQPFEDENDFIAHLDETKKCVNDFLLFLEKHKFLFKDYRVKRNFFKNLLHSSLDLEEIIKEASMLKQNLIDFDTIREELIDDLKTIKAYKDYYEICLFDSVCTLLTNYFTEFFMNSEFFNDIKRVLSLIWRPPILNQAFDLALQIDKEYFEYLLVMIKKKRNTQNLKDIRRSITDNAKNLIDRYQDNYKRTPSNELPNIQELLCLGLYNLVKRSLGDGFKNAFIHYFEKHGEQENFTLCSLIRNIDALPQQMQYFAAEILARIGKTEFYWFLFVIGKIKKNIRFKEISEEWVTDYIDLACAPPYCTFLNEFIEDKNDDLRELLIEISPKIFLMDLPKKVYGRTFFSRSIALKWPLEPDGSKGATFVIYLHELAHYLQRAKCKTIEACESPKSEKKYELKEGGYVIETMIFGAPLYYITEVAADYIVSKQVDQDHDQFKKIFNEKNEYIGNKKVISLHRSRKMIMLGECGSKFGHIKRKPSKPLKTEEALNPEEKDKNN